MLAELKPYFDQAEKEMKEALDFLKREFNGIRAGKANPALLDGIKVDYYGSQTPLNQVSNISAPEPRLLLVQPWDKSMIGDIEKAVLTSNLGLNPNNDGTVIRIPLPMLSEERRKELVKVAKDIAEQARISVRNTRRDAKDNIKKKVKNDSLPEDSRFEAEDEIQELTNRYNEKIESLLEEKEKEITTI